MLKLEIHIGTENINISGALVSHYTFVFCAFVFLFLSRSSLWSAISSDLDTMRLSLKEQDVMHMLMIFYVTIYIS